MAVSAGYCTAAEVLAQAPIDARPGKRGDLIAQAITDAEAHIDSMCNRGFAAHPGETRLFAPDAPRTVWTDDVTRVTQVRVRPDRKTAWRTLDPDDYTLGEPSGSSNSFHLDFPANELLLYADASPFPRRPRPEKTIEVTGDFGWPEVPPPVHRAAIVIAVRLALQFAGPGAVRGDIDEISAPALGGSVAEVERMLMDYRRLAVA